MTGSVTGGFLEALKSLCEKDKTCKEACLKFIRLHTLQDSDFNELLNVLASLLLSHSQTLIIGEHLRDVLPQILAVALCDDMEDSPHLIDVSPKLLHEKRCVTLSKLAPIHPDVLTFILKYFCDKPSPFHYWRVSAADEEPKAKKRRIYSTPVTDEEIAGCCYFFLKLKTDYFKKLWDWSHFLKGFLNHEEPYVRWLATQCCALLLQMGNQEKEKLLNSKLTPDEIVCFAVKQGAEDKRIQDSWTKACFDETSPCNGSLPESQNKSVINVAGISLPLMFEVAANSKPSLVLVNSTKSNLQSVALGIATRKTLCLQGPVGCGKTALVQYLAKLTGRCSPPHYLSVQLGDQTDSKMLLGTYQCTDIPGEFVWKPGVLTQAVIGGYWLLLEDIDSCATDVAAVLSSLLETGSLSVPGFKDSVHAAPGFQLFFTQRLVAGATGLHKLNSGVASMLQRHWLTVQMEPLSESELVEVVRTLHPSLYTVAPRMVNVFLIFSAGSHHTAMSGNNENMDSSKNVHIQSAGARLPSTRDLMKWCTRSSQAFDVSSLESGLKLYQDAVDIFCCNVSHPDTRLKLAESIAAKLGIIHTKAEYFCNVHKPVISLTSTHVVAGRISLPRREHSTAMPRFTSKSTFSFTRPTAALLERVASCIHHNEPVLLVGETGVGKTSSIQYLAEKMGQSLSVINMNQQSDSADLLGGFKPVELKFVISPLRDEFETLFRGFFAVDENTKFLSHIAHCFSLKKWSTLLTLMKHSTAAALKRFEKKRANAKSSQLNSKSEALDPLLKRNWLQLSLKLHKVEEQLKKSQNALAFSFVEGSLVKALQEGKWVLLDEINLASAQTLECLSSLLEGSSGSLYLLERGDDQSINRHPDFRIFAAMNPATDVGKRELPPGIRNRFTEFFVDELVNRQDLLLLCGSYLEPLALPATKLDAIVRFYLSICQEAVTSLSDGTGQKPHYSLRTLCRALSVAATNPCASVPRSLYEGILLSFLTQLDRGSHPIVEEMVAKAVMGKTSSDPKSLMKQPIPTPVVPGNNFIEVEGYWVTQGSLEPNTPEKYIMTKTVRRNLHDLVRVVSLARLPILLQGETSVGKTSLITYLAQVSGNRCLRINNHEHTDLQEYIGCYAADDHGNLVFKEGVLVEAMKYGHWVILDELNLAPSDVLEALNRVLDDNRELFIPETQKVVKAHPNFMLFATQNPPGLYGGRKVLSRAFRNRFIELHFDEIPSMELETIMHLRCDMPPSYCKKMVAVMSDLQVRRKGSAAFAGKQGFITLRDLFRWGERYRLSQEGKEGKYYDWDQHIADEGYLILAGRVRKEEECVIIQETLLKHIKRAVNPDRLFTLSAETSPVTKAILESIVQQTPQGFNHIVWTYNMRKLAVLLGKACEFKEPILLVGETGCGKTTLCQLLAASKDQKLSSVNCHMHSESADFLGGLRPIREHSEDNKGKLFEWVDGPLIDAMLHGEVFLADEISLADDSVLERLNSLLEPERKLLLAEKGSGISGEPCEVIAKDGFIFVGTMNPGGDYGKKELSPALRNRFTEIWCEGCSQRSDLIAVIEHNVRPELVFKKSTNDIVSVGATLVDFLEWFSQTELGSRFAKSIRDIMTWVEFINVSTQPDINLELSDAYIHGACLTFLDSLGTGLTSFSTKEAVYGLRIAALQFLRDQVQKATDCKPFSLKPFMGMDSDDFELLSTTEKFGVKPFCISKGNADSVESAEFLLSAPTTRINAMRVLRGLQLGKALLLEGSPGVGKTSLVTALSRAAGYKLTRINLSDQTDISDLFGADLPVEGGSGGEFAWRDGPFLQALRAGHWILLDELNLASQSVLEGLNAVLDHRGDLFIPELGRTFHIQSGQTRLFACQNPLNQGGARKGLPQSFLNRFTQVHMETLTSDDLEYICQALFPSLPHELIKNMVIFNEKAAFETGPGGKWGQRGGPWEMNLRDLSRWCEVTVWGSSSGALNPGRFVQLIYVDRMRTKGDKESMMALYQRLFPDKYPLSCTVPQILVTPKTLYLGDTTLERGSLENIAVSKLVLRYQLSTLLSLARCVSMGWMSILVGPSGCGKTSLVHLLAQVAGQELRTLSVNSAMDTTEILGGFEQADYKRHLDELIVKVQRIMTKGLQCTTLQGEENELTHLMGLWESFIHSENTDSNDKFKSVESEVQTFVNKIQMLLEVLLAIPRVVISSEDVVEVNCIQDKLAYLKNCALRDKSLNAGGKFEWVDSILIKSLTEGSWLLVDNVNLCSAAVLDRLNGLLEPHGVLTISERGVNMNGDLITIQPHQNFRLFLTMDPKYGEISRAMRNRGVEIFVTTSEGDMTTSLSPLDLAALLHGTGVHSQHDQRLFINLHQSMTSIIQGPDTPGLPELLNASFLFVQQVERGMAPIPSLLSSFIKVYIQSRLCDSVQTKRRYLSILEEAIAQRSQENIPLALDKLVSDCTLLTNEIQLDPSLATVKQRSAVLSALADIEEKDLSYVLGLLGVTDMMVDFKMTLTNIVVLFYQTCSVTDVSLAYNWLKMLIKGSRHESFLSELSEILYSTILSVDDLATCHLIWDRRWLPDVASALSVLSGVDDHGVENRVALLLYITAELVRSKITLNLTGVKKHKQISVLEYSHAISKGILADSLASEPIIVEVGPFLDTALNILHNALSTLGVVISDELWWLVRRAFSWTQRFQKKIASLQLNTDKNATDETLNLIAVHYKWFSKYTMPVLIHLAHSAALDVTQFNETTERMDASVFSNSCIIWYVAKRLRNALQHPLPIASDFQAKLSLKASHICDVIDLWGREPLNENLLDVVNFLSTPEGLSARAHLIVALKDLSLNLNLIKVEERLAQAENICFQAGLTNDCVNRETEPKPQRNLKTLLWPFQEAVCLNAISPLLLKLLKGLDLSSSSLEFHTLIQAMKETPSIPPSVIGLLETSLKESKIQTDLFKIIFWVFRFSNKSLAVSNCHIWAPCEMKFPSDIEKSTEPLPQHCPMLSQLAANLLFSQCPSSKEHLVMPSLDQHKQHILLLNSLQTLLWQNYDNFSNPYYSFRENELQSAKSAGYHFLSKLEESCCLVHPVSLNLQERASAIIEDLQYKLGGRASTLSDFCLLLSEFVNVISLLEESKTVENDILMQVGLAWTLLGCLESHLFSAFPKIDPTVKHAIKIQYTREEIMEIKAELLAAKITGSVKGVETDGVPSHPHLEILQNHLNLLENQLSTLSHQIAVRPQPPMYSILTKEMQHFASSLSSVPIVMKVTKRLLSICKTISPSECQIIVKEAQLWLRSLQSFTNMLEKRFGTWYPDIVGPLLTSSAKLNRGVELMVGVGKKIYLNGQTGPHHSTLSKLVCSLGSFPVLGPDQTSIMDLLSNTANRHSSLIIEQMFLSLVGDIPGLSERSQSEAYWLLKSSILELKNFILISQSCKTEEWNALIKVLRSFTQIWEKQENERRERELDSESLYKSRGAVRCQTVTEDEEALYEIAEMFPSKRENDFGDLEPNQSLEGPPQSVNQESNSNPSSALLSAEDVSLVSSVHMSLVLAYTKSTWFDCFPGMSSNNSTDFLTPWLQRFAVAARLISSCSYILNDNVDKCLLPSWILASYLASPKCNSVVSGSNVSPDDPSFDFYRTPCISEAQQCKPVLDGLLQRVNELLNEWPEHPTLNQIVVVVNRITSFPMESPLSRFLTGLEILLNKIREWEENAHSGVSLACHSAAVTNLIIQWRRLELAGWKGCLNSASLRFESRAHRWWFYIFTLVDGYINPSAGKEAMSGKDIVSSLEQFMEEAPLGEFQVRLNMVLAFHCHVINLPASSQRDELQAVLWNLFGFYSQFKDMVVSKIDDLKSPIEKKLKDYVKIARWNDINYWAVKDAVFKTQRTLHKHVKEFETVLKQPAKSTMYSCRLEGKSQSKKYAHLNVQAFIATAEAKQFIEDTLIMDIDADQSSVLKRASALFIRSKKLTKEVILSSSCPGLVAALNEFANDIVASVQQLASLEVDKNIPKPKQVSQAKNHLQMKRRALADLFRLLHRIGLSYHSGLTYEESLLKHEFTQLPPLDLSVFMKSLSCPRESLDCAADKEILSAWDGCSSYFMRSWVRYVQLSMALRHPHKDLSPPNIERLRGFPAHLITLTHDQHRQIHKNINLLGEVRIHLHQLKSLVSFLDVAIPPQSALLELDQRLKSIVVASTVTLQQFKLLLEACPGGEGIQSIEDNIPVLVHGQETPSYSLGMVKGDIAWQKANEMADKALLLLSGCQKNILAVQWSQTLFTVEDFKKMSQSFSNLTLLTGNISNIENILLTNTSSHPCIQSLQWIKGCILIECQKFSEICNLDCKTGCSTPTVLSDCDLAMKVNGLMQSMLLSIQKLYKCHTNTDGQAIDQNSNPEVVVTESTEEVEEEEEPNLQEKHLSDGILKTVQSDFKHMGASDISTNLQSLMQGLLVVLDKDQSQRSIRVVMKLIPILQQWILLYQFVLLQQVSAFRASTKLLSTILAVFGDVTVKGFCTPEGLLTEEEAGDGESDGKQEGSMGLGDGEGEKDVSERIESEDQLDDARPAGEEKKDEDKDCKEEEKGIEMSENFDGKLQDVEPKGDDADEDSESDDEKNDAEKEMGDTEKDADQLDQQIWGSDPEDDSSDEADQKDEEGHSGEKTGEKEMGARERETNKGDDNDNTPDDNEGKKQEESKPEVNEMKEPEVDDDQVDPYHGNHKPEEEPAALELPEDLKLDDGETNENEETNEENPFDIDEMKEKMPPEPEQKEEVKENQTDTKQDEAESDVSDDDNVEEGENENCDIQEPTPEESEGDDPQDSDERKNGQKLNENEEDDKLEGENEEEEKAKNEDMNPSRDDPTSEQTQASEDVHQGSMDQVASTAQQSQETSGEQPPEEADGDPGGDERDEVGQAPTNQEMKGHHSDRSGKRPQQDNQQRKAGEEEKRQRPGHSEDQRSLGDTTEPVKKRLKTVDLKQTEDEESEEKSEENVENEETMADLYQHIKDVKEKSTTQTLDAATKEQADKQPITACEEEQAPVPEDDDESAMDIENEEEPLNSTETEKKCEENVSGTKNEKQKKEKGKTPLQSEADFEDKSIEVEGEKVDTLSAARAPETTFHTQFENLIVPSIVTIGEVTEQSEAIRKDLQDQLSSWNMEYAGEEASKAWQSLSSLTNPLARDLSEQLRLVLEPTQATRMKGDFRTGRRINMRKVIPYIASQFRKDKIWMRRTKPSKREYQILLAIDDSSSMADNRSKELAFESLALVSQALTLLEVGELGVLSFGEVIKVLHKLGEPFTPHSGARLLQQFSFEQRKTQIGALVDYSTALFTTCKTQTSAEHAQLLVVISDGRGVFSEGQEKVLSCVRKARLSGIFMVFVIVDNPESKDSILDIRTPIFKGGKLLGISSYMDSFPFPFYLILRDISNLPAVLSDALRQWFELVSNVE
ncbi:midasin [Frankliniella occidentalis]|uniref:Midasin n=1 Tax=Frankliniella occidentalis TaxID=133901 RepID=A0A9C6XWD0_FRAOC|nr:midasin [Frankliniella occidentalis]